jgi:hypothetical protein
MINSTEKDIKTKLESHRQFFDTHKTKSLDFRIENLRKLKAAILKYEAEISEALWQDLHKSKEEAYLTEISIVLGEIDYHLKNLHCWTKPRRVSMPLKLFPSAGKIHYEPLGVTLIMAPWNYPMHLLLNPLVGAIAPFLFVGFYVGVYNLILLLWKKEHKFKPHLPYAFLVLVFLMHAPVEAQAKIAKRPHPPAYQNYFTIAREMQKQFPKDVICCCRKPELFTYYAPNIYAVNYKYAIESNELLQDLIQKKVDFVVLEQLGYGSTVRYLYPAIIAHPELFPVIWHLPNPDTYLLKFEREKAKEKLRGENLQ